MTILNKYKDTLDDFINSSNIELLDWPKLINKGLHNIFKFESSWMGLLESNYYLDSKNVLNISLELVPKT